VSAETVYGTSPVRQRRTRVQLADLDDAILAAVATEKPISVRGVFYRVTSAGAVGKTEAGYKAVQRRTLALRQAGRLPYQDITDGTRWTLRVDTYRDLDAFLSSAASHYRRTLWDSAGVVVHVFSEKDAITGAVEPVTSRWDVPLGIVRGYSSATFVWNVAQEVSRSDRPVILYHLGDHDPSGVDAWRYFTEKVREYAPAADVTFEKLAVTEEQIEAFGLPTRPTKATDTRSAGWVGGSVEVDAIPPTDLRGIVESAITQWLDIEQVALIEYAEEQERETLYRLARGDS
jgi:hypothetical protein